MEAIPESSGRPPRSRCPYSGFVQSGRSRFAVFALREIGDTSDKSPLWHQIRRGHIGRARSVKPSALRHTVTIVSSRQNSRNLAKCSSNCALQPRRTHRGGSPDTPPWQDSNKESTIYSIISLTNSRRVPQSSRSPASQSGSRLSASYRASP